MAKLSTSLVITMSVNLSSGCATPARFPKPYVYEERPTECDENPFVRWRLTAALWHGNQSETTIAVQKELPITAGDVAMPPDSGVECLYSAPMCMKADDDHWTGFRDLRCSLDHFRTFVDEDAFIVFDRREPSDYAKKYGAVTVHATVRLVVDRPARRQWLLILFAEDKRLPPDPLEQGR
jgi:hypothetical protein